LHWEPVWLRSANTDGKDHLVRPGALSIRDTNGRPVELVAWCSLTLTDAVPGGKHSQCRMCLREVKRYMDQALTEPPPRVVEQVLVTVDRPRDGHGEAADVIAKKLARMTSWKVTVTPMTQEDEKAA
jgi:hypothetical protein